MPCFTTSNGLLVFLCEMALLLGHRDTVQFAVTGSFNALPSIISDLCGPAKPSAEERQSVLRHMDFLLRGQLLKVSLSEVSSRFNFPSFCHLSICFSDALMHCCPGDSNGCPVMTKFSC